MARLALLYETVAVWRDLCVIHLQQDCAVFLYVFIESVEMATFATRLATRGTLLAKVSYSSVNVHCQRSE